MAEQDTTTLDGFLDVYGGTARERVVLDVDLDERGQGNGPLIVVRAGGRAVVITPMAVRDGVRGYLDVDVHPFVEGRAGEAEVLGWAAEMRDRDDMAGRSLVAVLVGRGHREG